MLTYETIFVALPDLPQDRLDALTEKVQNLIKGKGGEMLLTDKWGRRRLAYPIQRQREGYYVFMQFKSPSAVPAELDRLYAVEEDVIRHLTCRALSSKPATPFMVATPAAAATPAVAATPATTPATAPKEEAPHVEPAQAPAAQ